jgi:ABC-2 type transport system ATP-binding protein
MLVQARGLGKSFGAHRAVNDLSFDVKPGLVTGFLGPNGSGKSTTLRLMLGLDRGEGTTLFDGVALTDHPSVTRVVGTHLDAKLFHPQRTARAHLRMMAAEANIPDSRVDQVIDLMGLHEVARKRPKGFSLGMGQRLGLAGAVLADPQVLLLDEPANGLDPATIHWLRDFLKHYASLGRCVLVSSHLLSEMELMADEIIVIAKGELIANETISQFVDRSTKNDIIFRVSEADRFAAILRDKGFVVSDEGDNMAVVAQDTDTIGHIAFEHGIRVFELASRRASLEEAFLEMTSGKQEYKTGDIK